MRIVFMGTPDFAVASLNALVENNFNIVGVVTAPDKPSGRGQHIHQSAIKTYALEKNLKLLQPEKLKAPDFLKELKDLKADLQIVVAFRMLPEIVWSMPSLGTYNLHASLLPKYRGAAPINWALINGERETGVTTFKLQHEIDTGNILFTEKTVIDKEMNAGDLHDALMTIGAKLIVKTAEAIRNSLLQKTKLKFEPQNETVVSHAPKLNKENCKINWNSSGEEIYNFIRGLSPYPTAYTFLKNGGKPPVLLKIFKATFNNLDHTKTNGSLITDNKTFLKVYCTGGQIEINDIQLQGKKRMSTAEFLRGFNFEANSILL